MANRWSHPAGGQGRRPAEPHRDRAGGIAAGSRGLTNGGVARRLHRLACTPRAPRLRHVFAKLGVPNRVALAAVAHHSIK